MTVTGAGSAAANPPGEPVTRFRQALGSLWSEGGKLGLAVSGGPDSLALLLLSEAAIPGGFEVATVDHGLRPASADECAMVVKLCSQRGIPCSTLKVVVDAGNLQAMARRARYAALVQWAEEHGLGALATGHHVDDQAETLLMRLNRGSGVAGLAGVRGRGATPGSKLPLIRPLLGFRRSELAQVVASAGLTAVTDPSNSDERFDRVRLRNMLARNEWFDPAAIAASAHHLAEAEEALEWAAGCEWQDRVSLGEGEICYRPGAPRAIALRVIARILGQFGQSSRGSDIARLLDRLEGGDGGNLAGVLASPKGGNWIFRAEPPRRVIS